MELSAHLGMDAIEIASNLRGLTFKIKPSKGDLGHALIDSKCAANKVLTDCLVKKMLEQDDYPEGETSEDSFQTLL